MRRRTAAEASSEFSGSSSSASNNEHNDKSKDEADEDNLDETSDKETRLTLMEEVLLLGLKDKEVSEDCYDNIDVIAESTEFHFRLGILNCYESPKVKKVNQRHHTKVVTGDKEK